MKDRGVLDDCWGLYPLGRHARVTIPVDLTGPNTLLIKAVSVRVTLSLMESCMIKLHARQTLIWTAVSTIIRSHQYALSNRTNE